MLASLDLRTSKDSNTAPNLELMREKIISALIRWRRNTWEADVDAPMLEPVSIWIKNGASLEEMDSVLISINALVSKYLERVRTDNFED